MTSLGGQLGHLDSWLQQMHQAVPLAGSVGSSEKHNEFKFLEDNYVQLCLSDSCRRFVNPHNFEQTGGAAPPRTIATFKSFVKPNSGYVEFSVDISIRYQL